MITAAIIVAAGAGARMKTPIPKQFVELAGKPLLAHTLGRFESCDLVDEIILVLPESGFPEHQERMSPWVSGAKPLRMVPGGEERQDSVANGLDSLPREFEGWVAVHDGARPLVDVDLIRRVIEAAKRFGGAIAGLPVYETLKEVGEGDIVITSVDRRRFYRSQTPQCFRYQVLRDAIDRARKECFLGTDESALVERLEGEVRVVAGSERNLKVTTARDLALAEYYLQAGTEK